MSKKLKIPTLRFKEFFGEWEEKKLEDIAKFSKGKSISKSDIVEDGILECIRYGELYTHYKETINEIYSKTNLDKNDLVVSEYGDIIIPASGETQIDIATASCVLKDGVALSGDLNIIKTDEDGVFLSYYLNNAKKYDIARLSQGISVVHLYSSQLKLLKLNLPQKQEQEKIASFLTSVDTKIEQLTKKETLLQEYKKGVMAQIFSRKIRFKDDNGSEFSEWEEKKISDIFEVTRGYVLAVNKMSEIKTNEFPYPVYSSQTKNKGLTGYFNDYLYENSITWTTDGANAGDVNFRKGKFYCTNVCGVLKSDNGYANECIAQILKSVSKRYVSYVGNPKLMNNTMGSIKIKIPNSLEEQTKIANFLSSIDKKIELVQMELEKTKEFKKALLQQMFV
ncbi:MAG: restriction endonuclease subunit S [Arcobacteraceae bacterium]